MGWPAWLRYGLIAGVVAFTITLAANFGILIPPPADLCRTGPLIIPLLLFAALLVFVLMAGSAGFASARAGAPTELAALSGVIVGAVSGLAPLAFAVFSSPVMQRVRQLTATCPDGGAIFVGSTPPPGFVVPTPPPGAFGGTFGGPGTTLGLIGALVTIAIGIGIAYGAAALGAVIGLATRASKT